MSRRSRRKKINIFLLLLLIILVGFLCYKIYEDKTKPKTSDEVVETKETKKDTNNNKIETVESKEETKKEESSGPMPTEEEETKKERDKNITINMELIGEDEITINKGDKYVDQGIKATDGEGNDLTNDVEITNNVDTSKEGKYSIIYSYGKNIIIRRVIVK